MAARKEIEKAVKYKEFYRSIEKLLTPEDKDYLFYAMKEYNTYKSVAKLMLALNSCLDSPEKLDLLPYIRDLIPKHDKKRFDNLAPYNRMAHPVKIEPLLPVSRNMLSEESAENSTRIINLQRTRGVPLGFSIRGGQEHELGIYVSHVESFSSAEKAGLQVGDKVVYVNGIDFERVSHESAVLVLKSHDNLKIEVKNTGKVPGQTLSRTSFIWVDIHGNPVEEVEQDFKKSRHSISRDERSPDRLLSSADKHKIVLFSSKKRSLGFSIRGGSEYGLGIYISVIDPGSPSEEAGLQVGDQILDVNGHSFHSILHFEAVHILRSYDTLIMTIKSLGRLPTLQKSDENEVSMEQSPTTKRKASEFLKSLSIPIRASKRPSSATIKEEEEEPNSGEKLGSQSLKRSESDRQKRSGSLNHSVGHDTVDCPKPSRSNSFGSGSLQFHQNTKRRHMVVSPLATHETRASTSSPSPMSSPDMGSLKVKPKFFERGIGTQVMLASMTSQAEQLLFDKARRLLSKEDVEILKEDFEQYEETSDVRQFVDCLISIFNTPEKMELLRDVRSIIRPSDIVRFDEMISPYELKALRERLSESDSDDELFDDYSMNTSNEAVDTESGIVLTGIQHQNGHVRQFSENGKKSASINFGEVSSESFSPMDTRTQYMSSPDLYEVQTKETDLSHHNDHNSRAHSLYRENGNAAKHVRLPNQVQRSPMLNLRSHRSPVAIDIDKETAYIGLAIKTTPEKLVLVKEVKPGGAIDKDGFIQPGFEIVQVDNVRIRGKSYHDAAREIADAFKSDRQKVRFIIVPNYA